MLNDSVLKLPTMLTTLQTAVRAKTSFSHIERLHSMLYAYGATVIEVVRRKEFGGYSSYTLLEVPHNDTYFSPIFLSKDTEHSGNNGQALVCIQPKYSTRIDSTTTYVLPDRANERKKRQVYRSEFHGKLPFETRGMDDPVPTIDFSPTRSLGEDYALERSDVTGKRKGRFLTLKNMILSLLVPSLTSEIALMAMLDDLEGFARADATALSSVTEARAGLEKLIGKLDTLEPGFDRIAERSREFLRALPSHFSLPLPSFLSF